MLLSGALLSAHKPHSFAKTSPTKLRSPQGRISVSGPEGRQCAALAQGRKLPPAVQWWWLANVLFTVRNRTRTRRNVKNEGTSADLHENNGNDDKMSNEKQASYMKMHPFRDSRQQSSGIIGRKCNNGTIFGAKCHLPFELRFERDPIPNDTDTAYASCSQTARRSVNFYIPR